MFVFLFPPTKS